MPATIPGTTLYQLPPRRLYCGPAAICAITGLDYEREVRPAINRAKGPARRENTGVMGVRHEEMVRALAMLGWQCAEIPALAPTRWTLRQTIHTVMPAPGCIVLVGVSHHYVTVQDNVVVDNHRITQLEFHPTRRRHVRRAWIVSEQLYGKLV